MAKDLHQLDLFGMEIDQPVHIKAPVEKKKSAAPKLEQITSVEANSKIHKEVSEEEVLPTVSRTPMSSAQGILRYQVYLYSTTTEAQGIQWAYSV